LRSVSLLCVSLLTQVIRNSAFAVCCAELRGFASKSCPTVENFGLRFWIGADRVMVGGAWSPARNLGSLDDLAGKTSACHPAVF